MRRGYFFRMGDVDIELGIDFLFARHDCRKSSWNLFNLSRNVMKSRRKSDVHEVGLEPLCAVPNKHHQKGIGICMYIY
jgi:hypothetical protein